VLDDVFDVDQWPCYVVSMAKGFEPGFFGGEICGPMEISDGGFHAG